MSANDPKKNTNNLLFKPNNSISDEQPTVFLYSNPLVLPSTTATLENLPQTQVTENTPGQNNNAYGLSNINQSRNPAVEQSSAISFFDNLYQNNPSAPSASTNAPASDNNATSLISYFSNDVVSTLAPTLPLFPRSDIPLNAPSTIPFFSKSEVQPAPFPDFPTTTAISRGSSPSLSTLSASEISATATSSVPLFTETPYNSPPSIPLYSAYDKPPSAVTSIPLFSTNEVASKPIPTGAAATGPVNSYRRIGSKRPVYAPIPGFTNATQQQQSTNQLDIHKSLPSSASYEKLSTSIQQQQHFNPNPITKSASKDLFDPTNSTWSNSPFLSPVSEQTIFPNGELSNFSSVQGPIMPAMASSDVEISPMSNLMFSNNSAVQAIAQTVSATYRPPYHHWFYKKEGDGRITWEPFSMNDSLNLESNFTSHDLVPEKNIPTDGGRYDVNILRRQRNSVYWKSKPSEVRRCSWFHKSHIDGKYTPFEENIATQLEEEYKFAIESNQWRKQILLPSGDTVMFHSADVMVSFSPLQLQNRNDNLTDNQARPGVIKRGVSEYNIDEGESEIIDHLLFMVHGIGSGCDLKFRPVEEVVDDFRSCALQLVRTHYRSSSDKKIVHRVEILPISWHEKLHSEDTGIDNKLKSITLDSIPKLREFTNDTLLDILFYTSPIYGQTIISSVGNELNRIYELFKQRNPTYNGGISLAGHSLGSLILFDILCNQLPQREELKESIDNNEVSPSTASSKPHPLNRKMSRRISYVMGSVGTGQAQINYPRLSFQPSAFFALGSPIGMFVTIRGLDTLGERFAFPTCPGFYNIFHPYDPVAYRIESLINSKLANVKPVLIPHHKGRKRMHLELKETMAKVGSDLKQKLVDSMKNTWNSLLGWSNNKPSMQPAIAEEVDKVLEQFASKHSNQKEHSDQSVSECTGLNLGMLNSGRRIDYVLQEAPVEFFNEYLFALSSHVCYWESEDTVLLILKEIYNMLDVAPDCQIPQQTMTIERPPSASRTPDIVPSSSQAKMGMDPTMPIKREATVGPPPLSGFVKES